MTGTGAASGPAGLSGPCFVPDGLIEKTRTLPFRGEILVSEGDLVGPGTVVAHLNPGGYLHFVNVARELDVPFHLAAACVIKTEGEPVRRGEVVAARPEALGLLLTECRSPADGVVERIFPSGLVTIRSHPVPVTAPVPGRVVETVPGERIVLLTAGTLVQGVFGLGGERHGRLFVLPLAGLPDPAPERVALFGALKGAVVVTGRTADARLLETCVEARAAALVAPSCRLADLGLLGCDMATDSPDPYWNTDVPLTLILTEGFGPMSMNERLRRHLAALHGREASVNGFTQLRAGVERPELVVPLGRPPAAPPAALTPYRVGRRTRVYAERAHRPPPLGPGVRVRLLRPPHFGLEGEVVDLPPKPGRLPSGAVLPVVVVRLDDGRIVTAARANAAPLEAEMDRAVSAPGPDAGPGDETGAGARARSDSAWRQGPGPARTRGGDGS